MMRSRGPKTNGKQKAIDGRVKLAYTSRQCVGVAMNSSLKIGELV